MSETRYPAAATTAATFTRGWVRCYTLGLREPLRGERRAEIDSDLYEHGVEAAERKQGPWLFALVVLLRCLLGIPSDLSWRIENAGSVARAGSMIRTGRRRIAHAGSWTVHRGFSGVTWLLALVYGGLGALLIIGAATGNNDGNPAGGRVAGGILLMVACGAIIAGLRMLPGRRWTGLGLVFAGTVPLGLIFTATLVAPLATLCAAVTAILRARAGRISPL